VTSCDEDPLELKEEGRIEQLCGCMRSMFSTRTACHTVRPTPPLNGHFDFRNVQNRQLREMLNTSRDEEKNIRNAYPRVIQRNSGVELISTRVFAMDVAKSYHTRCRP